MSDDVIETDQVVAGNRHLVRVTFTVAALVVLVDQITKYLAVRNLEGRPPVEVIGTWVRFVFLRNSGAAFSFGESYTVIFTAIAITVVVVIVRTSRKLGSVGWAIALGGLLGGAVGNLLDRIFREPGLFRGHVVDFIAFPNFAVFNVADSAIVCSAVLMVLLALRGVEIDGRRS
ncbi:MAG TPA: signal peptidase II [Candidatus Angelobacter sp.]|nr:signal peptidase II [Candidatus Angelobacter sp.]